MKGGVVDVLCAYGQPKEAVVMRRDAVPRLEQPAQVMCETLESFTQRLYYSLETIVFHFGPVSYISCKCDISGRTTPAHKPSWGFSYLIGVYLSPKDGT